MNSGMISTRYARALFSYALEQNAEDTIYAEMQRLTSVFATMSSFKTAIDNPVTNNRNKHTLIITAVGNTVSEVFDRFIQLVINQKREGHLYRISLAYQDLYRKHKNITVGKLITATPLDNAIIDKIKKMVGKGYTGDIQFVTQTDPTIAGGFILFIDTYRLDASVATQFKTIKKKLLDSNKRIA